MDDAYCSAYHEGFQEGLASGRLECSEAHAFLYAENAELRGRNRQLEAELRRVQVFVARKVAEEAGITPQGEELARRQLERVGERQIDEGWFSVRLEVPSNLFWANPGAASAEVAAEVARIGQMRPERPNVPLRVVETTVSDPIEP